MATLKLTSGPLPDHWFVCLAAAALLAALDDSSREFRRTTVRTVLAGCGRGRIGAFYDPYMLEARYRRIVMS